MVLLLLLKILKIDEIQGWTNKDLVPFISTVAYEIPYQHLDRLPTQWAYQMVKFTLFVSPGSAEILVKWGEKMKYL